MKNRHHTYIGVIAFQVCRKNFCLEGPFCECSVFWKGAFKKLLTTVEVESRGRGHSFVYLCYIFMNRGYLQARGLHNHCVEPLNDACGSSVKLVNRTVHAIVHFFSDV